MLRSAHSSSQLQPQLQPVDNTIQILAYPQHHGYPLSAIQIYAIRGVWHRYTVELGDPPDCVQYRFLSSLIRDLMQHQDLAFSCPENQGLGPILDNIYRVHCESCSLDPSEPIQNPRVSFVTFLNGVFPYMFEPLGYQQMDLSYLEGSFKGALDEIPNVNAEQNNGLIGFFLKRKSTEQYSKVDTNQPKVVHPDQRVPIPAVLHWWEMSGNRRATPWSQMNIPQKEFGSLLGLTFKKGDLIDFCDFWIAHNRFFVSRRDSEEDSIDPTNPERKVRQPRSSVRSTVPELKEGLSRCDSSGAMSDISVNSSISQRMSKWES